MVLGAGDAGGGVGVPGGGDAEFSDEGGAGVDQVAGCCLGGSAGVSGVRVGQRRTGRVGWWGRACTRVGAAVAVLSPLVGCGAGTGCLLLSAAKGHGAGERRPAAGRAERDAARARAVPKLTRGRWPNRRRMASYAARTFARRPGVRPRRRRRRRRPSAVGPRPRAPRRRARNWRVAAGPRQLG